MNTLDRLKEVIASLFGIEAASITPEKSLEDDFGLDSLDVFDLVLHVEGAFDINTEYCSLEEINTVDNLVVLIEQLRDDKFPLAQTKVVA